MNKGHFNSCTTPADCWCEMRRYGIIFGIVGMILVAELIGGIVSQSLALLADAGHVLADTGALLVSIFVSYRVKRGASEMRTRRVGGYINAVLLGGVAIWIAIEAIVRFLEPREITSWIMISVAILGTIGNYVQHRIMKSVDEKHVTHESMHFHILSDLVQSFGVILGGLTIWLTGWILVDPMISMVIALMMMRWTWKLLKKLLSEQYDNDHEHSGHDHHH